MFSCGKCKRINLSLLASCLQCLLHCLITSDQSNTNCVSVVQVNPYEEFLLRQCQKMMAENRMVAVCQALPMSAEQRKAAKNKLMKKDLHLRFFNNSLMRSAACFVQKGVSALQGSCSVTSQSSHALIFSNQLLSDFPEKSCIDFSNQLLSNFPE